MPANPLSTFFIDYVTPITAAWLNAVNTAVFVNNANFASMTDEGPFEANVNFTPGVTESLTLSQAYGSVANTYVWFDGAYQGWDTYTLSGITLTFNNPIPDGVDTIYIKGGVTSAGLSGGTTAQRPASPLLYQSYFDTTLGLPIICSEISPSIVWVNAAGVAV